MFVLYAIYSGWHFSKISGSKSVEMAIDKIRRLCSLKQMNANNGSPLQANSTAASRNDKQVKDKEPVCGISSSSNNNNAMIIVIDDDDDECTSGGSSASANDTANVERRPAVVESIVSEVNRTSAGRNANESVVAVGRSPDGADRPRSSTEQLSGGIRDRSIAASTTAQVSGGREVDEINVPRVTQSGDLHVAASESQTADAADVPASNDGQVATSSAPASAASAGPPFQFNVTGFDFSKYNDMVGGCRLEVGSRNLLRICAAGVSFLFLKY